VHGVIVASPNVCNTAKAEIFTITKVCKMNLNFHWIPCQENSWEKKVLLTQNSRVSLSQQKMLAKQTLAI